MIFSPASLSASVAFILLSCNCIADSEADCECPPYKRFLFISVTHFKNASTFLTRRARRVSAFHCARLQSAGGVYLSGGLKPATETNRILFYPPLVEAGVFPTEIKAFEHGRYFFLLMPKAAKESEYRCRCERERPDVEIFIPGASETWIR